MKRHRSSLKYASLSLYHIYFTTWRRCCRNSDDNTADLFLFHEIFDPNFHNGGKRPEIVFLHFWPCSPLCPTLSEITCCHLLFTSPVLFLLQVARPLLSIHIHSLLSDFPSSLSITIPYCCSIYIFVVSYLKMYSSYRIKSVAARHHVWILQPLILDLDIYYIITSHRDQSYLSLCLNADIFSSVSPPLPATLFCSLSPPASFFF